MCHPGGAGGDRNFYCKELLQCDIAVPGNRPSAVESGGKIEILPLKFGIEIWN